MMVGLVSPGCPGLPCLLVPRSPDQAAPLRIAVRLGVGGLDKSVGRDES